MSNHSANNSPIKTAIIGYGMAAKIMHSPFLIALPDCYKVVAILERHKSESKIMFPDAKIVRNPEALFLMDDIELIIVTTPNDSHFYYAKAALEANKNVVVDKPFTIHSSEAKKLIQLSEKQNRIISVYQNRRFSSDFLFVKDILNKKILGEIHSYETNYHRYRSEAKPNAWRENPADGAGILYDLGAHLIDQALLLFGNPNTIYAETKLQRPHAKSIDWFEIHLDFGFTKAIVKAGMLVREAGPRFLIHGTKGSLLKYGEDPQEAALKAGKIPDGEADENWGIEDSNNVAIIHTEMDGKITRKTVNYFQGNYGYYYQNLYKTIRKNASLSVTPQQAYNTIRIIELAMESSKKGSKIECSGLI